MPIITETVIANRALQHLGAQRIAAGLLRTENSKNASEIRECYDTLRRAEMRRNMWRFSIRKVVLRPLESDSKFVAFGSYAAATTYAGGDIVVATNGLTYISKSSANVGNTPQTSLTKWELYFGTNSAKLHDADTTYYVGELVYVSTTLYRSKINDNADTPPSANWQTMTTAATLTDAVFTYPIASSPNDSSQVYLLPNGYLREAPQDPKMGAVQVLGGPNGYGYKDWLYEGNYLITADAGPILFRFGADVADPDAFDPLFVEGFAARIALATCETITQSMSKAAGISNQYAKFMSEARTVNGIEQGPVEPPLDGYIEARY